jgi:hypothetical protein
LLRDCEIGDGAVICAALDHDGDVVRSVGTGMGRAAVEGRRSEAAA